MNETAQKNIVIHTCELSRSYAMGSSTVHALRGANLQIEAGGFVALMGTSGSGKTTLLNLLGCLDAPSGGQYWLEEQEVSRLSARQRARLRNRRIGFIFQTFNLMSHQSALDNVMLPLLYRKEMTDQEARQRSMRALKAVGLTRRAHHRPHELSGGQRQRVAIARALVGDPAIILADEPTGNLDSATGQEIMRFLCALNSQGRTIIMVTHDRTIAEHARCIHHMRDGNLYREGSHEQP